MLKVSTYPYANNAFEAAEYENKAAVLHYKNKNTLLRDFARYSLTAKEFYRFIFPEGSFEREGHQEDQKANGIVKCINKNKKGKNEVTSRLIFDELSEFNNILLYESDLSIMSPISYFSNRRTANNASYLYAFTFDLDGCQFAHLQNILLAIENNMGLHGEDKIDSFMPTPTFIVNSGNGIHLYYVLDKPIPLYRSQHKKITDFKHALLPIIWNRNTTWIKEPEFLSVFQGFRIPGSPTKLSRDLKVEAFRVGTRVSLDYLNKFVVAEERLENINYASDLPLDETKDLYPEWYEDVIINKNKRQGKWCVKRALYDYWLNRIRNDPKVTVGHRYFCLCVLSSYARKCSYYDEKKNPNPVTYEKLKKDAYSLIPRFNALKNDFEVDDVENALNFWNESYTNFPVHSVESISGLEMNHNKRNGRKQEDHLARARAVQKIDYPNNEWAGRKKGTKDSKPRISKKKKTIEDYQLKHPYNTKYRCQKDTGFSINTIKKYWLSPNKIAKLKKSQ